MMPRPLIALLCALTLTLTACDDAAQAPVGGQDAGLTTAMPDMSGGGTADMPVTGDMEDGRLARPTSWKVVVGSEAPEAVRWSGEDVVGYLNRMGQKAVLVVGTSAAEVACPGEGEGVVALMGEELGAFKFKMRAPGPQSWAYKETGCEGGGALVELGGGGVLGRQYAAYEWLHGLGVRFFHPEQEFVPEQPRWPGEERMAREHSPDFKWRSVTLHLTHPLELGDVFRLEDERYTLEGKRYIDWQIKNGASLGHREFGQGEYAEYGLRRGLPRSAGFPLYSQQQGDAAVVDPDDPRPATEQIAAAIDKAMGSDPEKYPELFSFTYNPSEFTELDDQVTVDQLTFIAQYMAMAYPNTRVQTTNHAVTGEPTAHYKVRYFDLSKFAPANLGVQVHTVMFYDLFRPAPVYGNENFNYAYDFMLSQYQERPLWHYPEAAWWLTFDIALPLYLPITIEARDRDIQGISFMLQGKLDGHRVFGSGHEWGYWQNEYCPFRMAADINYRHTDCIEDIAWTAGQGAAPVVKDVLLDAISLQERDLIYGKILPYIVGTDPETELAASLGIDFHPLPPAPQEILAWDLAQIRHFEQAIAPALVRMERDYAALIARLDAVREGVPEGGRPWFDEIYDGLEATGLRAKHGHEVYGALVTYRKSQILFDPALATKAKALLATAKATTEAAIAVVRRREQGYRYQPLSRSIGGGPQGTEDTNWTVYTYRYLNRTHHGYYYTRIDDLVEEALEGTGELVTLEDAMITLDQGLKLNLQGEGLTQVSVDFGDGQSSTTAMNEHTYTAPGFYTVKVQAMRQGQPVEFEGQIAVVQREENFGFGGKILAPKGTELIEPVLPALVVGTIDETRVALGFSPQASGNVPLGLVSESGLDPAAPGLEFKTLPRQVIVPVVNRPTQTVSTSLVVEQGTLERAAPGAPAVMRGQLATDAIVSAVVSVGGFEEVGARRLVASILGFKPNTLPPTVPFELHYVKAAGD